MADTLPTPITRQEQFLATAAGATGITLPTPITREEQYLARIAENGSGGGGTSPFYPAGNIAFASLPNPSADILGAMYNITDAFTTDSRFNEGSGIKYPAGTNVAVVNTGTEQSPVYKFDTYAGTYVVDDAFSATSENPVQNKVVKSALDAKADTSAVNSALALKVDKVEGKGLSTNDYTNADKSTVDNSPIASTTTGINPTITDSANGLIQNLTVYGRTDTVEGELCGIGEDGELGITTANSDNTASTTATVTTGIPLYAVGDVKDELNEKRGVVIKRCEKTTEQGEEVIVPLATPVEIPLTASELSQLHNLRTYNPTTNVTITDDPTVDVGYLLDTDNGQAVAELENRIKSEIDEVKNENEKSHFCYSYKIDMSDSNPATCVKPHFDPRYGCDNFNFTSAHMDYANDKFDYGSWEGFIRRIARPCMLKYDGTVDYYLDPDDYSKKITGEASDVADVNYQGNAMVELEKLYFKRYTYNGIQYCFIADRKLDKSFKAYAHHDKYGRELDYIYRACYDGMYDGTRLRSISGVDYHNLNTLTAGYIMSNATRQEEMDFAKANNVSTERGEGWNILHKSEWDYINDILVLIGMSTDTQTTFGRGRDSGYVSTANTGIISTGTMDTKGLFWGENNGSAGVKVLGIENPWANIWKSCAGWMLISNQHYTKMTFGTEDGSTGTGFNTDGTGYLATGASISVSGYISDWAENDNGFLPTAASGSASTYRCDYVWQNTATNFALVGACSRNGLHCGAFCADLSDGAGTRFWHFGAALSYKPLAGGELAA